MDEVQFRGFSLASEKIDLSFPAGFHTLLRGNVRQSDIIGFQSVKGMVTKVIVDWILHSVYVPATGLYMLTLSTLAYN